MYNFEHSDEIKNDFWLIICNLDLKELIKKKQLKLNYFLYYNKLAIKLFILINIKVNSYVFIYYKKVKHVRKLLKIKSIFLKFLIGVVSFNKSN